MKKILLIICVALLALSSCQKNSNDLNGMNGSWKLIEVYDKSTATTNHKPAGSNMDIVISFLPGNKFAGHTIRNAISEGTYSQNGSEILFGNFSMTKIGEDEWGGSFLTVLHACPLQSQVPCASSTIQVSGNIMRIITPLRYDIILQRI
jgi:hypothetical protein